jgi:hypothetical protein
MMGPLSDGLPNQTTVLHQGGIDNLQHEQWLPLPSVGSDDLSNQEWSKCRKVEKDSQNEKA